MKLRLLKTLQILPPRSGLVQPSSGANGGGTLFAFSSAIGRRHRSLWTLAQEMNTEASHATLGRLLLMPDSWCWTGSFSHDEVRVDLRLNTFRPDQVPGLHVTTVCPEYCEAFERVKPMINAHMRSVADWVCSDLTAWFNESDLGGDDVLQRLKLSCVVLWPDGTATLWIDEPHLYETGHSIEADIGLDGTIGYLNLAG